MSCFKTPVFPKSQFFDDNVGQCLFFKGSLHLWMDLYVFSQNVIVVTFRD